MEGEGLEFNPQCNNKKENIEVEGNDSFLEYLLTFPLKPKSTFYIIDFWIEEPPQMHIHHFYSTQIQRIEIDTPPQMFFETDMLFLLLEYIHVIIIVFTILSWL